MLIDFLPVKWEKLLLNLNAAARAGVANAITFEFSRFISSNSVYGAARRLCRRYAEYYHIPLP